MISDELELYIKDHQQSDEKSSSFVDYLYTLMNKYNIDNAADIYNKVSISRQLWSSIISEKSIPSINVCVKIALAMHLNNHECKYLLKKAGYTLSSNNRFNLIIRFCIEHKIYNIYEVNSLLKEHGCEDSLLI